MSEAKKDAKAKKEDALATTINAQMQRYLSNLSIAEARPQSFQPDLFLAAMHDLLQSDIRKNELALTFVSSYDDDDDDQTEDEQDIVVNRFAIDLHSQCRASVSCATATAIDSESLGEDAVIRLFAVDAKTQAETTRLEFHPGFAFDSAKDKKKEEDETQACGSVIIKHPQWPNGIRFRLAEERHVTWTECAFAAGAKKKKSRQHKSPLRSPLRLYVTLDYMSFEMLRDEAEKKRPVEAQKTP